MDPAPPKKQRLNDAEGGSSSSSGGSSSSTELTGFSKPREGDAVWVDGPCGGGTSWLLVERTEVHR